MNSHLFMLRSKPEIAPKSSTICSTASADLWSLTKMVVSLQYCDILNVSPDIDMLEHHSIGGSVAQEFLPQERKLALMPDSPAANHEPV